jgi:uncharacterized protein involved in response to NO
VRFVPLLPTRGMSSHVPLDSVPHRLLFLVGAGNLLAAMSWWAAWLVAARWHWLDVPQPPMPAGWMHAVIMQYQVLPAFMFGFLLSAFPRWLGLPPLPAQHYLPVGAGLLGGQVITLFGLWGSLPLLQAGALLTFAGWIFGMGLLARLTLRAREPSWHALSCLLALSFGLVGLVFYALLTFRLDAQVAYVVIKFGGMPMLLPIYLTVCHHMSPTPNPRWLPGTAWGLLIAHLWLELRHAFGWLWLPDLALFVLFAGILVFCWPRERMPAPLRVLFLGFAWLPLAFALYAWQSAWFAISGEFLLGRAPAHALFIGCFGSLLVAMITGVTQQDMGRPLALGRVAATAFVLVQLVASMRVVAELVPDALAWQAVAALGWLVAFLPWVVRSAWTDRTPTTGRAPHT